MGRALSRIPTWAWLATIVVGSTVVRAILARDLVAPFIMVDEIIWSELGRGIADAGEPLLRDEPDPGYSLVYPLLISPVYVLTDGLVDAYAGVKTLNALIMSLAAVPAFFLARRVMRDGLALLAALMTIAIPSMAYTGTVMTENAFYPLFLLAALALVFDAGAPDDASSWSSLLALVGLAFATRVQTVAIAAAVLLAPLVLALFEGRSIGGTIARFRWLYGIVAAAAACAPRVSARLRRPARRLRTGTRAVVRPRRGAALPVVARRRALALRPGDPARGDDRPRCSRALARREAAGIPCGDRRVDRLHRSPWSRRSRRSSPAGSRSGTCSTSRRFSASGCLPGSRQARRARACSRRSRPSSLRFSSSRFPSTASSPPPQSRTRSCCFPFWSLQDRIGEDWIALAAFGLAAALAAAFLFVPRRYALALPLLVLGLWILAIRPIWWGTARLRAVLARRALPGDPHGRQGLDRQRAAVRRASCVLCGPAPNASR